VTGPALAVEAALGGWVRDLRAAAAAAGIDTAVTACDEIAAQRFRPSSRVCVVGERNRGKSALVNRLVDRALLPSGPIATPAATTTVAFARVESVAVTHSDGECDRTALDAFDWATAPPGADVVVGIRSPWLGDTGIEVVDTPGTGDHDDDALARVRREIARSDVTVLCVSALQPLSRSELQFVEGEVLRRHAPAVLVAVTMADHLARRDLAAEVLARVEDKVRALDGAADVEVLLAGADDPAGTERLRHRLAELAASSERLRARATGLASRVEDVAAACVAAAAEGERARSAASPPGGPGSAAAGTEAMEVHWDALELDLEHRRRAASARLRQALDREATDLVEGLVFELDGAVDPSAWWQRMVPRRTDREVRALSERCSRRLVEELVADGKHLSQEMERRFALAISVPSVTSQPVEGTSRFPAIADRGTARSRTRHAANLWGVGAMVTALLTLPPGLGSVVVGRLGSMAGDVAGSRQRDEMDRRTRAEARAALAAGVARVVADLATGMSAELTAAHRVLLERERTHVGTVVAARAEAAARDAADGPDWAALAGVAGRVGAAARDALGDGHEEMDHG
jgi:GTPase SAR1 family protein